MFTRMIYKRLHIPEKAEKWRPKGSAQMTSFEGNFGYLQHTTPRKAMTEGQGKKLLRKIERIANWLDNAVPGSPIAFGLDSLLVCFES